PTEIYNEPATRFVASFIGNLNVLNAQKLNSTQNCIAIDGQCVNVHSSVEQYSTDAKLSVAIRPEAIRLNGHGESAPNMLQGTVDDVYFLGSVVRVHVRLKDQFINMDMFNDPGTIFPNPGESAMLTFTPDACRVLTHESA